VTGGERDPRKGMVTKPRSVDVDHACTDARRRASGRSSAPEVKNAAEAPSGS